jgi:hypothetical protein
MSTTRDQTKRLCPAGNKNDTKTRIGVASDSEARIRNVTDKTTGRDDQPDRTPNLRPPASVQRSARRRRRPPIV